MSESCSEEMLVATPAPTLEEAKAVAVIAIDRQRDAVLSAGFTPTSGPLAGKTLQTRNVEDRTNWLTSQAAYSAAAASGLGSVADATFRTADNETVVCTYVSGAPTGSLTIVKQVEGTSSADWQFTGTLGSFTPGGPREGDEADAAR